MFTAVKCSLIVFMHTHSWLKEHADSLGKRYASELARRKDRVSEYKIN